MVSIMNQNPDTREVNAETEATMRLGLLEMGSVAVRATNRLNRTPAGVMIRKKDRFRCSLSFGLDL